MRQFQVVEILSHCVFVPLASVFTVDELVTWTLTQRAWLPWCLMM